MAITIAPSFCRTNLLESEEGGEEPELEVELRKLNHLCAAFRQIFLLSKDAKGESKKKTFFCLKNLRGDQVENPLALEHVEVGLHLLKVGEALVLQERVHGGRHLQ